MAVGSSFKQQCPSCEAMIPIRDASLVGRKVECPKCKDRFVVARPKDDDDDDAPAKPQAKKRPAAPKAPAPPPEEADPETDADAEGEGEGEAAPEPESASDAKEKARKKKLIIGISFGGVGVVLLAVVGWLMLGNSRPHSKKGDIRVPRQVAQDEKEKEKKKDDAPQAIKPVDPVVTPVAQTTPLDLQLARATNLLPNDSEHVLHVFCRNLLAPDALLREAAFETSGVLDNAALTKRLGFSLLDLDDLLIAERYTLPGWSFAVLHFHDPLSEPAPIKALDLKAQPAIKSQAYFQLGRANPWFESLSRLSVAVPRNLQQSVSHTDRPLFARFHDSKTLIIADATPMQDFLKAEGKFELITARGSGSTTPNPMVPMPMPVVAPPVTSAKGLEGTVWSGSEGPRRHVRIEFKTGGQVRVHSAETYTGTFTLKEMQLTLTLSQGVSYVGVLEGTKMSGTGKEGADVWKWDVTRDQPATPAVNPAAPKTDVTPDGPLVLDPAELRKEMYLTIRPSMKALLDRLETKNVDPRTTKVLTSSATNMNAAIMPDATLAGSDLVMRRPRQLWDVSLLLQERQPRIREMGTAFLQKGPRGLLYHTDLVAANGKDPRDRDLNMQALQKGLTEHVAPQLIRLADRVLGHKIELARHDPASAEKKDDAGSQIVVTTQEPVVDFRLDLMLDPAAFDQVKGMAALLGAGVRTEMDLASQAYDRHDLAGAGRLLGAKGMTDRDVAPGLYPPGVFPRPEATSRLARNPSQRISWMAGLLPHLGHEGLYEKVKFGDSWRDPSNWMAGRAVVSQFLDPSYPESARTASLVDPGFDFGATHFVGIAGVGRDAASYAPGDPAYTHKRGILGYETSLSVAEVQKGHGTANTVLMIQVPHDGLTGVSPWIAGGGATLRGVPETNSIAPFVLSKDRQGNPIQYQGRRGTYALMADGSVRFIDQNVSDDVFKAMCSVNGPVPTKFDLDKTEGTPLVPPSESKAGDKETAEPSPKEKSTLPPKKDKGPPPKAAPTPDDDSKTEKTSWVIPADRPRAVARLEPCSEASPARCG